MLVDSHCHLNFPELKGDLDQVIARARAAGVGVLQTICTEMEELDELLAITDRFSNVYSSVGVHPNDSANVRKATVEELVRAAAHPKIIGIGETGLDFHYDTSPKEEQIESFRIHIAASRLTQLPLIVHSRDADEATVQVLQEEMAKGPFPGLIHCFTSTQYLAEKSLEMGFYISFSGILSFKNAEAIRQVAAFVPIERILIETDAPFLAPVPYRGKTNEPSFVQYTNKVLAEIKQISEEECARATTENFFRLFSKAARPDAVSNALPAGPRDVGIP